GSIPPGVSDDIYADLIQIAKEHASRAVLDASAEPLRRGVKAVPWMAKPNIHELSMLLGSQPEADSDIIDAARALCETEAEGGWETGGGDRAFCVKQKGAWKAHPPKTKFVSAVGSGDSFLAAFLTKFESDGEAEALRWGVGAGAANAAEYGAGFCSL